MAEGEADSALGNYACIVECDGADTSAVLPLLEELTGQQLSPASEQAPAALWPVDNKYYSTTIELFVHTSPCTGAEERGGDFSNRDRVYQAIIFLCQLDKPESVGSLKVLWKRLKGQASREEVAVPDVCVVVGVGGSGPSTDSEVFHWCVGEGIELITWEREGEDPLDRAQDCDSDDSFPPDKEGVARLAETLQAHMWPNIIMKGRDPTELETQGTPHLHGNTTKHTSTTGQTVSSVDPTSRETKPGCGEGGLERSTSRETKPGCGEGGLERLQAMASSLESKDDLQTRVDSLLPDLGVWDHEPDPNGEDPDPSGESFESMFSRFADMKQHAESLSNEDRKVYAEKVVMAFWNAIGGDEEEIS